MGTFPMSTVESGGQVKDDGIDACDAFNELLDSTHLPVKVAGVRISPHMALWAQASDYKHKLEGWLLDLVWSGNLRKVVDDGR